MARADITVQALDPTGVFTAEQNGDSANNHVMANNGEVFLIARNADGAAPHTVTIVTPGTVGGLAITDQAVAVPASSTRLIGPLDPDVYDQPSGADAGKVYVNVDSSQLKLSAYRMR